MFIESAFLSELGGGNGEGTGGNGGGEGLGSSGVGVVGGSSIRPSG